MSLSTTFQWLMIVAIVVVVADKFGGAAAVFALCVCLLIGRVIAHFSGSDEQK